MAWPPPVLPTNRTNATPQQDTHPQDHNAANLAINDLVTQVSTLLPLGGLSVPRIVYKGNVTTDAAGNFAFATGFTPTAVIGIGAQADYPMVLVLYIADATQVAFRVFNFPSGTPAASSPVGVSYVVFGPKP